MSGALRPRWCVVVYRGADVAWGCVLRAPAESAVLAFLAQKSALIEQAAMTPKVTLPVCDSAACGMPDVADPGSGVSVC